MIWTRPPLVQLIGPALIDRRLDWAAWATERHQFSVNSDAIVEGVVRAAVQQRFESDRVSHASVSSGVGDWDMETDIRD